MPGKRIGRVARRLRRGLVLCLVAGLIAWLAAGHLRLFRDAATTIDDLLTGLAKPEPQNEEILVLTITEDVLAGFPYRSPIHRGFIADTIEELFRKGARLVALDIIFDQASEPELDRRLQEALRRYRDSVVVAAGDAESRLNERQMSYQSAYLDGIPTGLADIVLTNGVVRHIYPGRESDPLAHPSFVAAIARQLGVSQPERLENLRFRYRATEGAPIRQFPANYLRQYPDDWFADQIVFIGVDLPDEDRFRTPLAVIGNEHVTTPGVLIHAQALAQLMDGRGSRDSGPTLTLAIFIASVVAGYLLPLASGHIAVEAVGSAILLTLYWALAFALAAALGLLLPVVQPTLGFLTAATASSAYGRYRENRQRRFLSGAFRRYVSPAIIDEILANPDKLALGGAKRELSFVFCDLAGFTTLSERLAPEDVVAKLQAYFDGMLRTALHHGGTIDRLVGDGMAVIFGAPVDRADHATAAVACALELDRFCESYRGEQIANGIDWGITRIGVHTGTAIVGNVGSSERFHYTAHGDCVNTAARLEGANRLLGTRLCISGAAAGQYPEPAFRPVGRLVPKGKSTALECVTLREPLDDAQLRLYMQAYTLLEGQDAAALAVLEALAEVLPDDGLIAFHRRRARLGVFDTRIVLEEK